MSKPYTPFLAFLILLMLTIPFSFDFAYSVVPGWHTTIFPPYFILEFLVIIILLFVAIGYWLLSKRVDKTNWALFAIHFTLTIPTIIFLKFPSIFLNVEPIEYEKLLKSMEFQMKLVPVAWTLFIAGQILFLIYYIRTIKTKRNLT
jgi:hypothetical protein